MLETWLLENRVRLPTVMLETWLLEKRVRLRTVMLQTWRRESGVPRLSNCFEAQVICIELSHTSFFDTNNYLVVYRTSTIACHA